MQRESVWKDDNHPDAYLDTFVGALNTLVGAAATLALSPDGLDDGSGYIELWKDTAVILRRIEDDEIDFDNEDEAREARAATSFAAARYGYAVETLACAETGTLNAALPAGCSFQLQGARGMTRPDIIVTHSAHGEIAWFDITSSGSIGHIDLKTGSGWRTKNYVAEVVYDPLDISAISASNSGIGERVARRNAMRRRIATWQQMTTEISDAIDTAWESADQSTVASRQAAIRSIVTGLVDVPDKPEAVKSILRAVGKNVTAYGYTSGGSKSQGEAFLRNHLGT